MKKILGLDLGTNSIGWALVNEDKENKNRQLKIFFTIFIFLYLNFFIEIRNCF